VLLPLSLAVPLGKPLASCESGGRQSIETPAKLLLEIGFGL